MSSILSFFVTLAIFLDECEVCLVTNLVDFLLFSFGYEDEISQPQIEGLDPQPRKGEQRSIPPG